MRRKGAERDSIYMVVAKNIKYYRKSRNMTQAQLAEKTEYSHEFIRSGLSLKANSFLIM